MDGRARAAVRGEVCGVRGSRPQNDDAKHRQDTLDTIITNLCAHTPGSFRTRGSRGIPWPESFDRDDACNEGHPSRPPWLVTRAVCLYRRPHVAFRRHGNRREGACGGAMRCHSYYVSTWSARPTTSTNGGTLRVPYRTYPYMQDVRGDACIRMRTRNAYTV